MTSATRHARFLTCGLAAFTALVLAQTPTAERITSRFTSAAKIVLTEQSMLRALPFAPTAPLASRSIRSRGGAEVFAKVAPSVVVVRTDSGHGTGFVIDPSGLVVTNNHVVEDGLRHGATGSYAMVHLGHLESDGTMALDPTPRRAFVYKLDPTRDLALLKIEGVSSMPALTLSEAAPRPGISCLIVGHPAAGMLWSIRSGQVASVGRMPGDIVDFLMMELAASSAERASVSAEINAMPSRRILLTSAPVNPGDSGGPVVDENAKVIGVTFAVPRDPALSKMSYHVHLDELKAFLKDAPSRPLLVTPDPWQFGPRVELMDLDGDGQPDVLAAGTDGPETLLFDLDNDTPGNLLAPAAMARLVSDRKWEFEVAVRITGETLTAFYDTDNDGEVDLILAGHPNAQTDQFTRGRNGTWAYASLAAIDPLSGNHLPSPAMTSRFNRLLKALVQK